MVAAFFLQNHNGPVGNLADPRRYRTRVDESDRRKGRGCGRSHRQNGRFLHPWQHHSFHYHFDQRIAVRLVAGSSLCFRPVARAITIIIVVAIGDNVGHRHRRLGEIDERRGEHRQHHCHVRRMAQHQKPRRELHQSRTEDVLQDTDLQFGLLRRRVLVQQLPKARCVGLLADLRHRSDFRPQLVVVEGSRRRNGRQYHRSETAHRRGRDSFVRVFQCGGTECHGDVRSDLVVQTVDVVARGGSRQVAAGSAAVEVAGGGLVPRTRRRVRRLAQSCRGRPRHHGNRLAREDPTAPIVVFPDAFRESGEGLAENLGKG
mmetsp:Transcript_25607/g.70470  ORF Transcript_25607/g.70470 Transcript_25607/m.70470 type:complete len:317 (-) Transcript_25607:170-1120(-)